MELMRWASLVEDYGKELREGSADSPATDVFTYTEEGEKRWKDLKNRVVEHVSDGLVHRLVVSTETVSLRAILPNCFCLKTYVKSFCLKKTFVVRSDAFQKF